MAFSNSYPYTDYHELNLDWLIDKMKELDKSFDDFKAFNTITFKGTWSITTQYPAWSVVDNNNDGYLSIKVVPAGVDISNEGYWVRIANYSAIFADFQNRLHTVEVNSTMISLNEYGIVGDGSTDHTTVIQGAIDTCATSGKTLYIPKGTYRVTGLELKNGINIVGADVKQSIIFVDNGGSITGDQTIDNVFNGNIRNVTIFGDSTTVNQNGFNFRTLSGKIDGCIVRNFKGIGYNLLPYGSDYQTAVNTGENHALNNCLALNCGTGFQLSSQDNLYSNIVSALCDAGVRASSCYIDKMHIWGYKDVALNLGGSVNATNVEVEAATVGSPNANIIITNGGRVNISNFNVWNVRTTKSLIYLQNADYVNISNLSVGPAGTLNPEVEATNVAVFTGTAKTLIATGSVDESYTTGTVNGATASKTFVYMASTNLNAENVIDVMRSHATYEVTATSQVVVDNIAKYKNVAISVVVGSNIMQNTAQTSGDNFRTHQLSSYRSDAYNALLSYVDDTHVNVSLTGVNKAIVELF